MGIRGGLRVNKREQMPKILSVFVLLFGALCLYIPSVCGMKAEAEAEAAEPCASRSVSAEDAVERTREIVNEAVNTSFPELKKYPIRIKTMRKEATYFETRFSISRYLAFRGIRIIMSVNPCVFELGAPLDGIRAIIAHELGHADYYRRKNFFQLVSLVRLVNGDSSVNFERKTDLVAIERGYGDGLIKYRKWLYQNIPQEKVAPKKRSYFTPEEIALLIPAMAGRPDLRGKLSRKVPRNIAELRRALER